MRKLNINNFLILLLVSPKRDEIGLIIDRFLID